MKEIVLDYKDPLDLIIPCHLPPKHMSMKARVISGGKNALYMLLIYFLALIFCCFLGVGSSKKFVSLLSLHGSER